MANSKRDVIDHDLGTEREARQDLLNALVRAQSLAAAGQLHTAMSVLESEMRKIRAKLKSELK